MSPHITRFSGPSVCCLKDIIKDFKNGTGDFDNVKVETKKIKELKYVKNRIRLKSIRHIKDCDSKIGQDRTFFEVKLHSKE